MSDWYLSREGKHNGPYTWELLLQMAQEGSVLAGDLIWSAELKEWTPAGHVPGLLKKGTFSAVGPKKKFSLVFIALSLALLLLLGWGIRALPGLGGADKATPLGTMQVSAAGGSFALEGMELSIAGTAGEPVELAVSRVTRKGKLPPELAYRSDLYRLEGKLGMINGTITVTLPLDPEALKHPYNSESELAQSLFIVLTEEVFTPSAGIVQAERLLPTRIDLAAGTLSSILPVGSSGVEIAFNKPIILASLGPLPRQIAASEEPSTIQIAQIGLEAIRYSDLLNKGSSRQRNFIAVSSKGAAEENVEEILDELERQKIRLEELGFSFAGRDFKNYPVTVNIKDLKGRLGLYEGSKFSNQGGTISLTLKPYFWEPLRVLQGREGRKGEWDEIVSTAGHELLHLSQSFYDQRSSFLKYHAWTDKPYHWLDEAVATWYEPFAQADSGYISDNALKNRKFIHKPLFLPEKSEAEQHGYGASFFITYLTNRFGDRLPARIYEEVKAQGSSDQFAGYALNSALSKHHDTETAVEWVSFLAAYLIAPGEISPNLKTGALWNKTGVLRADTAGSDLRLFFDADEELSGHMLDSTDGRLAEGTAPAMKLQFSLLNLTGDAFRLALGDDAQTREALQQAGSLRISVTNSGDAGLLVYASNDFFNERGSSFFPVAKEPWHFLASSAPGAHQGGTETAVSFGYGEGAWEEILFIPFNYDDTGKTRREAVLTVEITFEPFAEGLALQLFNPYDSQAGRALAARPNEDGYPLLQEMSWGSAYGLRAAVAYLPEEVEKVRLEWDFSATQFESAHGFHGQPLEKESQPGPLFFETYGRFFQPGHNRIRATLYHITNPSRPQELHTAALDFYLAHIISVREAASGRQIDQWARSAAQPGETIRYECLPNAGDFRYRWNFGDGTTVTGTEALVTHRYTAPGRYKVTLELLDTRDRLLAQAPYRVILVDDVQEEEKIPFEADITGPWTLEFTSIDWVSPDLELEAGDDIKNLNREILLYLVIKKSQEDYQLNFFIYPDKVMDELKAVNQIDYQITEREFYFKLKGLRIMMNPDAGFTFNGRFSGDRSLLSGEFEHERDPWGTLMKGSFRGTRGWYIDGVLYDVYFCDNCGLSAPEVDGRFNLFGEIINMDDPCPYCGEVNWRPF